MKRNKKNKSSTNSGRKNRQSRCQRNLRRKWKTANANKDTEAPESAEIHTDGLGHSDTTCVPCTNIQTTCTSNTGKRNAQINIETAEIQTKEGRGHGDPPCVPCTNTQTTCTNTGKRNPLTTNIDKQTASNTGKRNAQIIKETALVHFGSIGWPKT